MQRMVFYIARTCSTYFKGKVNNGGKNLNRSTNMSWFLVLLGFLGATATTSLQQVFGPGDLRRPVQDVVDPKLKELHDLVLGGRQERKLQHLPERVIARRVLSRRDVRLKGHVWEAADGDWLRAGRHWNEVGSEASVDAGLPSEGGGDSRVHVQGHVGGGEARGGRKRVHVHVGGGGAGGARRPEACARRSTA